MDTPIYDFLKKYSESSVSRFHMPGHKGKDFLGFERFDITEIKGADSLYEAEGIIKQSEKNASEIFDTGATFYSAEGSSLSIKAMLYASLVTRGNKAKKIVAVRNVHKSFINACALLDIDIEWIYPETSDSLCSGTVTDNEVIEALTKHSDAFALYITSPNYIGQITDIAKLSAVCKKHDIPLLVDNAHGAYLKFCGLHPIDLGADMCSDSAHKTLPVLTGGAYLHISKGKEDIYAPLIKNAMSAFGSTSPSYLIMASLDLCNKYLNQGYSVKLTETIKKINALKTSLKQYTFYNTEPLKISIKCNGYMLAEFLRKNNIECEYADGTVLVLMITPENTDEDFSKLIQALKKTVSFLPILPPAIPQGLKKLSVREAFMAPSQIIDISQAEGQICATPCVSCPPAIPIAISGEIITKEHINIFEFYKIKKVNVVK